MRTPVLLPLVVLLPVMLTAVVQGATAFLALPSPSHAAARLSPSLGCRVRVSGGVVHQPRSRWRRQPLRSVAGGSASSSSGRSEGGTAATTPSGEGVTFSDDWKAMVEEGIPVDLGDFEEVPGIMAKPQQPDTTSLAPRGNDFGVVFPEALQPPGAQQWKFIQAFTPTRRGRDAALPVVRAGEWWRLKPEARRAWLEEQQQKQQQRGDRAAAGSKEAAVVFRLRGWLLGTSRVRYDSSTGRIALVDTPLLERNRLFSGGYGSGGISSSSSTTTTTTGERPLLPALLRWPIQLARPLYAPLFCLRWLSLRTMVLLRALQQFVLPSWPYLLFFTARAAYLLAACMLLTVLVDELLQPFAQWLFRPLQAALPDFRGYSLRPDRFGEEQRARTWVERWSQPLTRGGGAALGTAG